MEEEKESKQKQSKNNNICPFYSEVPYESKGYLEGFKNLIVISTQGRCSETKRDCCCIGDKKQCEKKKKTKDEK